MSEERRSDGSTATADAAALDVGPAAAPPAGAGDGVDVYRADGHDGHEEDEDAADALISPEIERLTTPRGAASTIPVAYPGKPPSFVFLATVSIVSLASDIATKLWAEHNLDGYPGVVTVWENHVAFVLAKNRGGAWGLLQSTNENVRRPFFLLVSAAAIAFIVTLYRRLQATQRALKWGLPLVLGGALGNVFDRIRYGHVIDFIDVHMKWKDLDHHWPTFNVADIAICVGVGLMAIDMFTSKRPRRVAPPAPAVQEPAAPATDGAPEGAAPIEPAPVAEPVAEEPSPSPATDVPPARAEAAPGAAGDASPSTATAAEK